MTAVIRFAWGGGAVAVSTAAAAIVGAKLFGGPALWALVGWAATALPAWGLGIDLARRHGLPGPGFFVALGTGMIVRFAVVLGTLAGALHAGGGAYRPWLLGVVAGYLPMQLFEIVWFHRRGRELAAAR